MRATIYLLYVLMFTIPCFNYADQYESSDNHRIDPCASAWRRFEKNRTANNFINSNRVPFGFWYNSDTWNLSSTSFSEFAEISFYMKGQDVYGMMINEGITIPYNTLRQLFVEHMENISSEFCIVCEEKRLVNGIPVTYMQVDAMLNNIKINYMIYFCCEEGSTIQLYTWSFGNSFTKHKDGMEDLLNGFSNLN